MHGPGWGCPAGTHAWRVEGADLGLLYQQRHGGSICVSRVDALAGRRRDGAGLPSMRCVRRWAARIVVGCVASMACGRCLPPSLKELAGVFHLRAFALAIRGAHSR